ncbi:hypothetical protein [Mycolicibacterium palauense]|uniref:hypothetical protein n=1 Tax=Mycolicibacterium palauense TaxID=2034511 RepID=UPI002E210B08
MSPKPNEESQQPDTDSEQEVPAVPAETDETKTDQTETDQTETDQTTDAEAAEQSTDAGAETPKAEGETTEAEGETTEAEGETAEAEGETAEAEGETAEAEGETTEDGEGGETAGEGAEEKAKSARRTGLFGKVVAFALLPALALLLGGAAAYLKWEDVTARGAQTAREETVQVAKDSTIKMLSYKPETVEQDLNAARDLLTGDFRNDYTQLVQDVVIPGAKEQQISAVATVPAVASMSADADHAEVLVFVNQTVVIGGGAPTATASSVKVSLDKVGDRWLVSGFDPI